MYTLQGKTWPTRYVCFPCQSMYAPHTLPVGSPRTWQPFTSHQQHWTDHTAPEKKGSWHNPQPDRVIRRSATQFLSQDNHWSSNESQAYVDNMLHWFTDTIIPACDRYVHYLLTGANPSVLNQHKWGLQPWRYWHARTHSLTFLTDGLPFSPSSPARSEVNQNQHKPLAILRVKP
jgi:hypothetical protein